MARNSSFAFKGKAITTEEIARRLGVRYILSGSLRRGGTRIRISVQLIDAETGGTPGPSVLKETCSTSLPCRTISPKPLQAQLSPSFSKRKVSAVPSAQNLTAWDLVRRGVWEFNKFQHASHIVARDLFAQAIEVEPASPDGFIWLARAETGIASYDWVPDPEASINKAMAAALKAVQLDERNPYSHYAVGVSHAFAGRFETAIRAGHRAIALSPSYALGYFVLGAAYLLAGRAKDAIEPIERALRLSPFDPQSFKLV